MAGTSSRVRVGLIQRKTSSDPVANREATVQAIMNQSTMISATDPPSDWNRKKIGLQAKLSAS